MKFSAAALSVVLCFAGTVSAHNHIHRRHKPSATYVPPPSTTTAAAPPPTSTSAPSNGACSKRGVPYNDAKATKNFGDSICWAYNWAAEPGDGLRSGLEYIPMLWSNSPDHTKNWQDDATAAIAAGATHLLGFNEPDLGAQANMDPQAAASAWKQYMEPFAGKAKLCSPAITNGGAPMGTAWLDQFMSACHDCTIDCIAIHIYDSATNVEYYKNYISSAGKKYGKPVWVTEMGANGSDQDKQKFLQTMLPFLDDLETVERYAYFMAGQNILTNNNGALTSLGNSYNSI